MGDFFGLWLATDRVEVGGSLSGRLLFPDLRAEPLQKVRLGKVILRVRLHGSGNTETKDVMTDVPFEGPPARGEYPFTFEIPQLGPVSWAGRHVKVTWEVAAELDIAWAVDPRRALTFTVLPRGAL